MLVLTNFNLGTIGLYSSPAYLWIIVFEFEFILKNIYHKKYLMIF